MFTFASHLFEHNTFTKIYIFLVSHFQTLILNILCLFHLKSPFENKITCELNPMEGKKMKIIVT